MEQLLIIVCRNDRWERSVEGERGRGRKEGGRGMKSMCELAFAVRLTTYSWHTPDGHRAVTFASLNITDYVDRLSQTKRCVLRFLFPIAFVY